MTKYVHANPTQARHNPLSEIRKDYEIPGYVRVKAHANPQLDEFMPLYGRVIQPGRRNPSRARRNNGEAESLGIAQVPVGQYGRIANAEKIEDLLSRMFDNNMKRINEGLSPVPICIWGSHGLGKTTLIRSLADQKGWAVSYCAPAQFEEMGDLHGIPERVKDENGRTVTVYAKPKWAPDDTGRPGILIMDDFNRADDRILRGLMQLFQDGRLASWSLPSNWMIVATANPEGKDYAITPLDDAMKTRMLHIELIWDNDVWMKWATKKDKLGRPNVDPRAAGWVKKEGDNFIGLPKYPRTTPRSLEQLFGQIRYVPNWKSGEGFDLISTYAYSALDRDAANSFLTYVRTLEEPLMDPKELLFAGTGLSSISSTDEMIEQFFASISDDSGRQRIDKRTKTLQKLVEFMLGEGERILRGEAYPDRFAAKMNPRMRMNPFRARRNPGFRMDSAGPLFSAAKHNLCALLLDPRFPMEEVKKITDTMTLNSEVDESEGQDQFGGWIEKLSPKLILEVDVVKKAAGQL